MLPKVELPDTVNVPPVFIFVSMVVEPETNITTKKNDTTVEATIGK